MLDEPPPQAELDQDGRHVRSHTGHAQYAAVLGSRSRELADLFSAAVVALIEKVHPGALKGSAAPPLPDDSVGDLWQGPTP